MSTVRRKKPSIAARGRPCPIRLLAVLALVPTLLYLRSVTFDFVQADDVDLIVRNQPFLGDLTHAPAAFGRSYFEVEGELTDVKTYYRPLVVLSFMLDAQIDGARPAAYHVTNVVLHAAVVLLLFRLLVGLGTRQAAAFLTALVFAVHPLNVQAVCWIVGRNDLLLAVFALLSMLGLIGYIERRTATAAALHLVAYGLALYTKESGLMLLPVYGLFTWLWLGRPRFYPGHRALLVGYGIVTGAWLAMRTAALAGGSGSAGPGGSLYYLATIVANLPQLLLYAGKVLFPFHLSIMPSADTAGVVAGGLAIGILGLVVGRALGHRRALFVLGWFLLFLAPTLLVPALPAYENRAYVPLLGVLIGVSQVKGARWPFRAAGARRVAAACVVAILASLSARHAGTFADRVTYWESATRGTAYAPIAHVNLGRMDEAAGRLDRAESHYRAALALDPTTPKAHNDLGVVLMARGEPTPAEEEFRQEIRINPGNAEAHFNLGLSYKLAGRVDEAVPHWEETLRRDPYFVAALEQLVAYHRDRGDTAAAASYANRLAALERRQHP